MSLVEKTEVKITAAGEGLCKRVTPDTLVEKSALTVTMLSFLRTVDHAVLVRIKFIGSNTFSFLIIFIMNQSC